MVAVGKAGVSLGHTCSGDPTLGSGLVKKTSCNRIRAAGRRRDDNVEVLPAGDCCHLITILVRCWLPVNDTSRGDPVRARLAVFSPEMRETVSAPEQEQQRRTWNSTSSRRPHRTFRGTSRPLPTPVW